MIPFTQYVMPDGRKEPVEISRPEAIEVKARQIIASGFRFEVEMLKTGEVSMTITNDKDGDVAIEVVPDNGPGIPEAVDRMIMNWRPQ